MKSHRLRWLAPHSPRAPGGPRLSRSRYLVRGFIPARAGRPRPGRRPARRPRVHPRARGAAGGGPIDASGVFGTSPRARGGLGRPNRGVRISRYIPARAGRPRASPALAERPWYIPAPAGGQPTVKYGHAAPAGCIGTLRRIEPTGLFDKCLDRAWGRVDPLPVIPAVVTGSRSARTPPGGVRCRASRRTRSGETSADQACGTARTRYGLS